MGKIDTAISYCYLDFCNLIANVRYLKTALHHIFRCLKTVCRDVHPSVSWWTVRLTLLHPDAVAYGRICDIAALSVLHLGFTNLCQAPVCKKTIYRYLHAYIPIEG